MSEELQQRAVAFFNRGYALQLQHCLPAAIAAYDQALVLVPNFAACYSNRGAALISMNRCDEALSSLERAISLRAGYAEAHFCRAVALLMLGDLPAGWIEFEWRWETAPGRLLRQDKHFPQPSWRGEESAAGKTVLLYSERGLGDTLQFCRYALLVSQLHANVVLQVQAPLVALMRSLSKDIQVVSETESLPQFDFHCPLLSLPLVFKTSLQTIPAPRRYLRADAEHARAQAAMLDGLPDTARVGLVWRGDAHNPDDQHRSIALRDVLSFLTERACYISLQKEILAEERSLIEAQPRFHFSNSELDFQATAALCECLDVVVTIDTSIAHLAAALGVKTWILLPFNADCRWLLQRADSPWYPTVTLYRQSKYGDWADVLARVRADLERLPRSPESL